MTTTRQEGQRWERAAESMLRHRGLRTVVRNFHCRAGEIDLIMLDGPVLVFVEVRYRRNNRFGSGADSVTAVKRHRIITAARQFLGRQRGHRERPCRFDVVSIGNGATGIELNWIRGAFDADDNRYRAY